MDYIINPSWFYWISVLDAVNVVLVASTILSFFATALCSGFVFCGEFDDEDEARKYKKALKISIMVLAFSIVGVIFIPSKQTLIEMMVARYATKENAQITVDALKSVVDYIIEAIKSVK